MIQPALAGGLVDRWIIEGADKTTGQDVIISIEADSESEALDRARERGILVSERHVENPLDILEEAVSETDKLPTREQLMYALAVQQQKLDIERNRLLKSIRFWVRWVPIIGMLYLLDWALKLFLAICEWARILGRGTHGST